METYTGTTLFCCGNAFFLNMETIPEMISKYPAVNPFKQNPNQLLLPQSHSSSCPLAP